MGTETEIEEAYWHLKAALRVDGSITIYLLTIIIMIIYNNFKVQE